MLAIQTNAGDVAKALAGLARDYPDEARRGLITFAGAMEGDAKRGIRTGVAPKIGLNFGFNPLSKLTREVRRIRGKSSAAFGGNLNTSVRSYSQGDTAYIGWPPGLAPTGQQFQKRAFRPFTAQERRRFYRFGVKPSLFGGATNKRQEKRRAKDEASGLEVRYARPARSVWAKIVSHPGTARYMLRVVNGRIRSLLEKRTRGVASGVAR